MWATVVHLVAVGAARATVVLVVVDAIGMLVDVGLVDVGLVDSSVETESEGAVPWSPTDVGTFVVSIVIVGVTALPDTAGVVDSTASPFTSPPALQLTVDVATTTASTATRTGRATARV